MRDDNTTPPLPRSYDTLLFWTIILVLAALVVAGTIILSSPHFNPDVPNLNL
jgi:hypothetical protein